MRAGSSIFLIFVIFYISAQHSNHTLINQKWSVVFGPSIVVNVKKRKCRPLAFARF